MLRAGAYYRAAASLRGRSFFGEKSMRVPEGARCVCIGRRWDVPSLQYRPLVVLLPTRELAWIEGPQCLEADGALMREGQA